MCAISSCCYDVKTNVPTLHVIALNVSHNKEIWSFLEVDHFVQLLHFMLSFAVKSLF